MALMRKVSEMRSTGDWLACAAPITNAADPAPDGQEGRNPAHTFRPSPTERFVAEPWRIESEVLRRWNVWNQGQPEPEGCPRHAGGLG